jgi:hypothetical protein
MAMNKNLVSFTWSVLRLSSLCGLAFALTVVTHANAAKACYGCVRQTQANGSVTAVCLTGSIGASRCLVVAGSSCYITGNCGNL